MQAVIRMAALLLLLSMAFLGSVSGGGETGRYTSIKTDAMALLSFKKMIQKDPDGALSDWHLNKDPCTWHGVSCSLGRVAALDLAQSNLVGQVSFAPFSSLDMLTSLNLSANALSVNATTSLVQIPYGVKQLELSFSGILGHIPESFFANCPNLEYVNLAFNNITGFLPQNLFLQIDNLQYLDLSYNNITGSIANLRIESCSSLSHLDWSGNQMVGSLPASFSNCTNLNELILPENFLSGEIPPAFGALKSLQRLDLSHNHLSGWIPFELGSTCSSLVELKLSNNNLTGTIPVSFSSCSSLQLLDLSNNNLTGPFPDSILKNLASLESIKLRVVDFSSNMLAGIIPPDICPGAASLEELRAPDNLLYGPIPAQLSQCSQLRVIDFSINYINGSIPSNLGILENLEQLIACGEIPPRLGRQLGAKALTGILSGNTLVFVRNVGNSCRGVGGLLEFSGIRPERLLQVPSLRSCDFTRLYSGPVLSLFTRYQTLEYLDLSYNQLRGKIPDGFGEMIALQVMVLSHNQLSGEIPASLGQLKNLGVFDASHNRLQGHIPDSFRICLSWCKSICPTMN
ncbi:UNVERIFIED_CONTAM: Serine/threonine-protein kinase BRI1-like 2 [Sesamum angustifolium]|uniref:non-specific serine/threonine protein kinase n=1 Tax=Sesamum angustifolium TaxID=2727405 RepID=A0AAW2M8L7_9LAMI